MDETSSNRALIGNAEYPLVQNKLRVWLELEEIYANIIEAADNGNREKFVDSLYSYISVAFSISIETLKQCNWFDITRAFREMTKINRPSIEFPMFRVRIEKAKMETVEVSWEYPKRLWYIWLHELASAYGWSIEYIENLSIDYGIALLEEILVDHQLNKEWEWGMSANAFSYDEGTKKSKFLPIDRPEWMKPIPKPIQKVKIKASELPIGLVLKWNTDTNEYTQSQ